VRPALIASRVRLKRADTDKEGQEALAGGADQEHPSQSYLHRHPPLQPHDHGEGPAGRKAEVQAGTCVYRDPSEWIGVKVPAIVCQEVFDKAQEPLRHNVMLDPLRLRD
jgi:hypothetical protein